MARDYYTEASGIARSLEKHGLIIEAQALIDAIDAGSTATEILMALRWHLQRIDESNPAMGLETRCRIRDLRAAIGGALNG
jgi:hypothetical protein